MAWLMFCHHAPPWSSVRSYWHPNSTFFADVSNFIGWNKPPQQKWISAFEPVSHLDFQCLLTLIWTLCPFSQAVSRSFSAGVGVGVCNRQLTRQGCSVPFNTNFPFLNSLCWDTRCLRGQTIFIYAADLPISHFIIYRLTARVRTLDGLTHRPMSEGWQHHFPGSWNH